MHQKQNKFFFEINLRWLILNKMILKLRILALRELKRDAFYEHNSHHFINTFTFFFTYYVLCPPTILAFIDMYYVSPPPRPFLIVMARPLFIFPSISQ